MEPAGEIGPLPQQAFQGDFDDDDARPLGEAARVAIRFEVSGVTARKVDAATWEALDNVGGNVVAPEPDGFQVDVDCRIEPTVRGGVPAPPSTVHPRGA